MTTIIDQTMPESVRQAPSEQIHGKLLNLRDQLDEVSDRIDDQLSSVMNECPKQPETDEVKCNSGLPPLFEQYDKLIGHIELVVRDINVKLDYVSI